MTLHVRRVVTGPGADGHEAVLSDGPAPVHMGSPDSGYAALLWLDGSPRTASDGGDEPPGPWRLEPPPGGLSSRVIRLPPPRAGATGDDRWLRVRGDDEARPGMHTTDTLDIMVMLEGEVVLGLDDGEYHFRPGDVVVQRGTAHRWRVVGDRPCTYAVTMFRPDPAAPGSVTPLRVRPAPETDDTGFRRLVTGTGRDGRSGVVSDGPPPVVLRRGSLMSDMWQTGGPLRTPDQGGDIEGTWELDPAGMGIAFRMAEWTPSGAPSAKGWHSTPSIDIDFILAGRMDLEIPNTPPLHLGPGDVVIQRGTEHRWTPVGDEPVRMAAAMIGIP